MVDLKDRINKPRVLRGTPSYAFVNKLSLAGLLITSACGILYGVAQYLKDIKSKDYGKMTVEKVSQQYREDTMRNYVQERKRQLERERKEKEHNDMGILGS